MGFAVYKVTTTLALDDEDDGAGGMVSDLAPTAPARTEEEVKKSKRNSRVLCKASTLCYFCLPTAHLRDAPSGDGAREACS